MKNFKKSLLATALSLMAISSANAVVTTSNMQATANVVGACTIEATAMAFGAFTPTATADTLAATSTLSSVCSNGVQYTLSLDKGTGTSIADRSMPGAIAENLDRLQYNIYQEVAHTTLFGEGVGETIVNVGTGVAQSTTLYGKILTNQFITPDAYAEQLTVTLTY
ncbi:MAG: spore coat protein [Sphingobacteriaceae bacterium]|nr:spore coat protein [Sphingobacteriaceae bacterium]